MSKTINMHPVTNDDFIISIRKRALVFSTNQAKEIKFTDVFADLLREVQTYQSIAATQLSREKLAGKRQFETPSNQTALLIRKGARILAYLSLAYSVMDLSRKNEHMDSFNSLTGSLDSKTWFSLLAHGTSDWGWGIHILISRYGICLKPDLIYEMFTYLSELREFPMPLAMMSMYLQAYSTSYDGLGIASSCKVYFDRTSYLRDDNLKKS